MLTGSDLPSLTVGFSIISQLPEPSPIEAADSFALAATIWPFNCLHKRGRGRCRLLDEDEGGRSGSNCFKDKENRFCDYYQGSCHTEDKCR